VIDEDVMVRPVDQARDLDVRGIGREEWVVGRVRFDWTEVRIDARVEVMQKHGKTVVHDKLALLRKEEEVRRVRVQASSRALECALEESHREDVATSWTLNFVMF
jgi:hypothetical protein